MSIQTETLGYPRIDKNREVKKALLANSSGKSEAERRWQTVHDVQTFGEGWHNNHHAFQSSARFGWRWWEVDIVWLTIRLLEKLRLATNGKTTNSTFNSGS